jgi:hypothetical protein
VRLIVSSPRDPDARGLLVLLGLLALVAANLLLLRADFVAIAVVCLVVDYHDTLARHQLGADAADHLAWSLAGAWRLPAALQDLLGELWRLQLLAQLEGVVVGDHHARLAHVVQHVTRDQVAHLVVVLRIARQQNAEAVLDCDAGRDDQEGVREVIAAGTPREIDRLPGDQHRHDGGLAAAGRHLQSDAEQLRIGFRVELLNTPADLWALLRGDLG